MVRICSDDDVAAVLDLADLVDVVAEAFRKQAAGAVERPERPHFPVGTGLDADRPDEPLGTGLAMPAYVHGADRYATKLVGVHEGNADRDLPTVNATVALTAADTGRPRAYLAGNRITNARTGCIGALAVRELRAGTGPLTLGVLGAGTQARWQVRAIDAVVDIDAVRVYSPSSREACAADLRAEGIDATAVDSPAAAVRDADGVVTATTSETPVFDGDDLAPGTVVVAVGAYTPEMTEIDARTVERAATVFADVPEEVAAIGDVDGRVDRADLVPFGDVLRGRAGRGDPADVLLVESVGSAVLDAAAAEAVYERAVDADVGTTVEL
jgi:alanine dehydrogenase